MAGIGPAPKLSNKRRRRTPPASYGAAKPVVAPAAPIQNRELGIEDPHPLVESMWSTLHESVESMYYSEADWARLRLELWYANTAMRSGRPSGPAWAQIQRGLNALLISPADKRRAAIELKPPVVDAEEDAAILQIAKYQDKLKPT